MASLNFTTSRASNNLQVGDSWVIAITGAAANAPVSVYGGANGVFYTNAMGQTDANGGFRLTGAITSDIEQGTWTETWMVSGSPVGTFSFTVGTSTPGTQPVPNPPPPPGNGGSTGGGTTGTVGTTGGSPLPPTIGGFNSTFVLLGGAAAVFLLLVMRR